MTEAELIDTLLKACTAASDAESSLNSVLDALRGDEWSDLTKALARAAGRDAGPATKRRGWLRRALGLAPTDSTLQKGGRRYGRPSGEHAGRIPGRTGGLFLQRR